MWYNIFNKKDNERFWQLKAVQTIVFDHKQATWLALYIAIMFPSGTAWEIQMHIGSDLNEYNTVLNSSVLGLFQPSLSKQQTLIKRYKWNHVITKSSLIKNGYFNAQEKLRANLSDRVRGFSNYGSIRSIVSVNLWPDCANVDLNHSDLHSAFVAR